VFHALVLSAAMALAWARLGRRTARGAAWILSLLTASALPVWIFRFTPEAFHAALALAGLTLVVPGPDAEIEDAWTTPARRLQRAARAAGGGVLLGLLAWNAPMPGLALVVAPLLAVPGTMGPGRRRLVWSFAAATTAVAALVVATLHWVPFA